MSDADAPSYRPKPAFITAYEPVVVQFGKLNPVLKNARGSERSLSAGPDDIDRGAKEARAPLPKAENSIERDQATLSSHEREYLQFEGSSVKPAITEERLRGVQRLMFMLSSVAKKIRRPDHSNIERTNNATSSGTPRLGADWTTAAHDHNAKRGIVPEAVARRFLKVDRDYYFHDRARAFSDHGERLATSGTHSDVVSAMVEIAKARGWGTISVRGSDDFRRSVWVEARKRGVVVVGYRPTPLDLADIARSDRSTKLVKQRVAKEAGTTPSESLVARSAADANADMPTVVPKLARIHTARSKNPDPELAKKAKAFERNKPTFVVKKYPELAGAYGIVQAARAFAEEKLPETARDEFVRMARLHVIQKILAGEMMNGPKIYLASSKEPSTRNAQAAEHEALSMDGPRREKKVARER